jgi:hypothetical protein
MKKIMFVLSLLATVSVFGARLDAPPRRNLNAVNSPRRAEVLREARGTFTLPDGSLWVTHPVPAESEPSAVGVTRFGIDGSTSVFLVSDWLPKGSIPNGWAGQVFSVTMLTDGRVATSAGWTDGHEAHNAIFILRGRGDGTYSTDKKFEWPGIAQIVGGPKSTILAATNDPFMRNGGPMLTLFNANGAAIGAHDGSKKPTLARLEAAQHARSVRLQRMSENRFAVYEPATNFVWVMDIEVAAKETIWTGVAGIFIGEDPRTAHLPVIGLETTPGGDEILVARTGRIDGKYGTKLTLYNRGGGGDVKQTTVTDAPWNLMIRENDQVHGVVRHRDVLLDTVRFVAD